MGWIFGRRQRVQMGVTFRNIVPIVKDMKTEGTLEGKTDAEVALDVLTKLTADQPEAFNDPAIDWDALLAFIEKLIPLILKIIELFT